MNELILLALIFCLSFGIESVFGVAGAVLALTFSALFFDVKEMVVLVAFVATTSSILILLSDYKSFNWKILLKVLLAAVPGIFLGVFALKSFASPLLMQTFAVFLIAYALWTFWSPTLHIPKILKVIINFIGGIFTGLFGTGGAFFIIAMREEFSKKSEMRTTLASIFLIFNLLRIFMYQQNELLDWNKILPYWWIIFPMIVTMLIGYKIHLKISEKTFQKGISVLLGIAGISFLF